MAPSEDNDQSKKEVIVKQRMETMLEASRDHEKKLLDMKKNHEMKLLDMKKHYEIAVAEERIFHAVKMEFLNAGQPFTHEGLKKSGLSEKCQLGIYEKLKSEEEGEETFKSLDEADTAAKDQPFNDTKLFAELQAFATGGGETFEALHEAGIAAKEKLFAELLAELKAVDGGNGGGGDRCNDNIHETGLNDQTDPEADS